MKWFAILVGLVMFCSGCRTFPASQPSSVDKLNTNPRIRYCGYTPEHQFVFDCEEHRLRATPEWKKDQDNPPLSVRAAIRAANKQLLNLVKHPKAWVMTSVEIEEDTYTTRWFYKLNYERQRDKNGNSVDIGGEQLPFMVIVLMDGTLVNPKKITRK